MYCMSLFSYSISLLFSRPLDLKDVHNVERKAGYLRIQTLLAAYSVTGGNEAKIVEESDQSVNTYCVSITNCRTSCKLKLINIRLYDFIIYKQLFMTNAE